MNVNAVDQISELPEGIIHHILSFLNTREVVQISVLSKRWNHLWASFPILNCNQNYFGELVDFLDRDNRPKNRETREKFMNFVENSLLRFDDQKIHTQKFKLYMSFFDFKLASRVDKWIELATANHAKVLDLNIHSERRDKWYNLPQSIFAAKSLTSLMIESCQLQLEQPFSRDAIKFCSLRVLLLRDVHIEEQLIQQLICCCPLIEYFYFLRCWGVKNLQISKLHKLKMLQVSPRLGELESVDIEAPSLQIFNHYFSFGLCTPWIVNMVACQGLKQLDLRSVCISDHLIHVLISKFPCLELLSLHYCNVLKRVKISNYSLKSFILEDCDELLEAEIDAPNLLSFRYGGVAMPLLSSTNASLQWEVKLKLYSEDHFDTLWCLKLREFLGKSNQIQVLTLLVTSDKISFNSEELRENLLPPLCELEHLILDIRPSSLNYAAIVDGLLWSCHPTILSIQSGNEATRRFIKFLLEKLMAKEDLHCCNSTHIKCWRHYLKEVNIESFKGTKYEMPLQGNGLLGALPAPPQGEKIRFRLIW